jgi:uncharacterized protein (UPF0276 family)
MGIGVGLRGVHFAHILEHKPSVDWFEIISENYLVEAGRSIDTLEEILHHYPVVQHGVALYLGNTDPINKTHLKKLKQLVKRTKTPFLSDHLCWGSVDGHYSHDLLPMPYTRAAAKVCAENIKRVRDDLQVPVLVENVSSYTAYRASEMTEWEFLSLVLELSDAGVLLDVNNIYVSSRNHGFDPWRYVESIDPDRIGQVHIAGHRKLARYLLDTHDSAPLPEVWRLYERVIQRAGPRPTLLEWDANIPSFETVHQTALGAKKFLDAAAGVSAEHGGADMPDNPIKPAGPEKGAGR